MLIGDVNVDLGRAMFVGGLGLAAVALVVVWVRDCLMGKTKDSPAEVPFVGGEPEAIQFPSHKRPLEPLKQVYEAPVPDLNSHRIYESRVTSPSYYYLPYNIHNSDNN